MRLRPNVALQQTGRPLMKRASRALHEADGDPGEPWEQALDEIERHGR